MLAKRRNFALMKTSFPPTTSRVRTTTNGSLPWALIPKKFQASPMWASPQPDSMIAWASVTEAGTPVSLWDARAGPTAIAKNASFCI
jgi:hypothetical protein